MNVILLISVFMTALLLTNFFKLRCFVSVSLSFFLFLNIQIILIGFVASWFKELANINFWAIGGMFFLVMVSIYSFISNTKINKPSVQETFSKILYMYSTMVTWWKKESTSFQKISLLILLPTVLFTTITNLNIIFNVAPHNWDSMTYHLAQIPYFLQYNSFSHFGADYWAQDVHPKNASILKIYVYLVTGLSENLMQLVQFFSYIASGISVYGISRLIGGNKFQGIIAALIFSLLTESLMESITTQNDMIITAFVGIIVYYIFLWERSSDSKYLLLTGLAIGFASGIKLSFMLALPSIAIIFLYLLYVSNHTKKLQDFALMSLFSILSVIALAMPSGYIENIQDYGHPAGPEHVRLGHSFEGRNFEYIINSGSKNVLRFGFDFLSLDGFPPVGLFNLAQKTIQLIPRGVLLIFGIDLKGKEGSRTSYRYTKNASLAHEDTSSWGIFGFSLVWLSMILSLLGFIKSNLVRVLSVSTIIFVLVQSFIGPYDPWRGRYFLSATIFGVPTLTGLFNIKKTQSFERYLLVMMLLGSLSAIFAVVFRSNSGIIDFQYRNYVSKSIFNMDRLEQLTRNRKCFNAVFHAYEQNIPEGAIVATILGADQYEYPLFGERFTRIILPLNPFDGTLKSIPAEAEYLYFDSRIYPDINIATDIFLGCETIYLRKL